MNPWRLAGGLAGVLLLALSTAAMPGARSDARESAEFASRKAPVLTHTITGDPGRFRLRLHRISIRAPQFAVLVQQPDGSLRERSVGTTRAYAGSVEGRASALAVAVRRRDGVLAGQVTVDGRQTLFFEGGRITSEDGTARPRYHWPSADDATRNVTVRPAQLENITRRWDVGYDLDASYLVDELDGSVSRALDEIELTAVRLLATYEPNARLRPAIGRVVLRASRDASPYAGREAGLDDVRAQWRRPLLRDAVDAVAYLHSDGDSGGVAYVGTVGGEYAVSRNGSGNSIFIIRHELGHSWGPSDNHTNGPEGQTIESGNDYARFDGTELAAILTTRSNRLAESPGRFPRVAVSRVQLPPYATLDLRDRVRSGDVLTLRPLANDLDANGDRLRLTHVPTRSHLGVPLRREGNRVRYRAPSVDAARTLDWFRYRITDRRGGTATGVAMIRIGPR